MRTELTPQLEYRKNSKYTDTFTTQQVNDATTKSGKTQLTQRYSSMTRAGKDPPSLKDLTKKSSILTSNKSHTESCDNMNLTAAKAVQSSTSSLFGKQLSANKL